MIATPPDDAKVCRVHNGLAFPVADVPVVTWAEFRLRILSHITAGGRIAAMYAHPRSADADCLSVVLAHDTEGILAVLTTTVQDDFPSLTPECAQVHLFEREIFEQRGIMPVGHPWLKPVRFPQRRSVRGSGSGVPSSATCGVTDYFRVSGDESHEVAVGPVHAGIIEPGHFRFACRGEIVDHLEISLGYQHRGVEQSIPGRPTRRTLHYLETLAGDTTIGHAMTYCRALEGLTRTYVSPRAQVIRGIALELERMANHIGDLGALAGDVGYLPTMSYCGRIRGDVLNMTAVLCGNRFGRGLLRPGGVAWDLDAGLVSQLKSRLRLVASDVHSAVELLWNTPSVLARFEQTGTVTRGQCEQIGLVGVAARACGVPRDVRQDFSFGIYRFAQIPVSTCPSGDVFARALVRYLEVQRSVAFLNEQLDALPAGRLCEPLGAFQPDVSVVALVEGWRGEICHVVTTGSDACIEHYKIVDPSFHNWFGLAIALREQQISDFPLCNKSFNLSYCGHDL